MKRRAVPKSEQDMKRRFPISDRVPGWFFRLEEVSAGAYLAEGADLCGRQASRTGADPEAVLEACMADARTLESLK